MFCEKCGNQLNEDEKVCTNCGQEVSGTVEVDSKPLEQEKVTDSSSQQVDKHNKSKKLPIMICIAIGVLLIASVAIFAMNSSLFKSPKQLYLEVEGNNVMDKINTFIDKSESVYDKNLNAKPGNASESNVELSGGLDLSSITGLGLDSTSISKIDEILNNLKVVIDAKNNPKDKQNIYGFNLLLKGNKLLNGEVIQDNGKLALSVPVLYSKYLTLNTSDLNALTSKIGINANLGTGKQISRQDIIKAIKFSKGDFIKLVKKYGKTLSDSIDSKQVTLDKNTEFKVNDLSIKCDKFTVDMDEKSFKAMVLNVLDQAKDDDLLYSLTVENVKSIIKLFKDAGIPLSGMDNIDSELSKDNFKSGIDSIKTQLEESFKLISMPNGIKMTIYVDGDKIIGRTLETKIKSAGSDNLVGVILNYSGVSNYENRNIFNYEVKISTDGSGVSSIVDINEIDAKVGYDATVNKSKGTEVGKLKIQAGVKGKSFSASILDADIGLNIDKGDGSQSKYLCDYDITVGIPMSEQFNIKGKFDFAGWVKEKEKKDGSEITTNTAIKSSQSSSNLFAGSLKIKIENTKDIDFKLPEINSSNSVDITKASSEQMNSILMEVMQSLQKVATDNPDIMKMLTQ